MTTKVYTELVFLFRRNGAPWLMRFNSHKPITLNKVLKYFKHIGEPIDEDDDEITFLGPDVEEIVTLDHKIEKYYQPEFNGYGKIIGHEQDTCYSFQVWHKKKNLLKKFPNCKPVEYSGNDIEDPTFVD